VKLTEAQAERILGSFSAGADWAMAARLIGTSRMTLRRAVEADAGLAERVEDARAQADEVVVRSLYTKATKDKDTTAMIFWLKNRRPDEWRDRRDVTVDGSLDVGDVVSPEVRDQRITQLLATALARQAAGITPAALASDTSGLPS
jgi:hypothetical protein